jgi:hypothetical protein
MNLKNIFIFYLLYYYLFENNYTTIIEYCGLTLFPLYCIIDLLFYEVTIDKKIHHLLGLLLCFTSFLNKDKFHNEVYFVTNFEISTEISTIFLIIKDELELYNKKQSIFYKINNLVFTISFLYSRIFSFFDIQDKIIQIGFLLEYNYLYFTSVFGLFYINIFWFVLILKKIFKTFMIESKFNKIKYSKYICSYTNLFYIPLLMHHIYQMKFKNISIQNYIYFYISNIILSFSSYRYHRSCYQSLKKYNLCDIFDSNIFYKYEFDILSCHLNLYSLAYCLLSENFINILNVISILSFIIHCVFTFFTYNPNQIKKYNDLLFLINIIIYYSIYSLFIFNTNISYNLWFLNSITGIFLLILINTIKPFYNVNHILLHFTSWFILQNTYNYIETK